VAFVLDGKLTIKPFPLARVRSTRCRSWFYDDGRGKPRGFETDEQRAEIDPSRADPWLSGCFRI